ncbi:MAG: cell division protein FtsH, partial [Alphaproteobacteria bacterium]|nr:cell division protein FtsH [Alphaproteobacteria bacterium]
MPNTGRNLFIWLIIGIMMVAFFTMFQGGMEQGGYNRLAFSDFLSKVDQGQVGDVTIRSGPGRGSIITGHATDGAAFVTSAPDYPELIDRLSAKGVKISALIDDGKMDSFWSVLFSWFPILLLVGVYVFFMRQMQGGGGRSGALGFGKSRARLLTEKTERVTFEDVAGIEEAKE